MDSLAIALFLIPMIWFVMRVWGVRGRAAARDRWDLIAGCAVAVAMFVFARLVINWVLVPVAIWNGAVVLLASGVIGAVARWPALPWLISTHRPQRTIRVGITLLVCALVMGVAMG